MRGIYTYIFCLYLGVVLFGMPPVYSTSPQISYSAYTISALYPMAMQVYGQGNNVKSIVYANGPTIIPKDALAELKKQMLLSPKRCVVVVRRYLYQDFGLDRTNYSCQYLIPIISDFLVQQDGYQKSIKDILCWAANDNVWDFVTEYLEEEMMFSHSADNTYFRELTADIQPYYKPIYTHKHNFSKKRLLLFLINDCGWPVPINRKASSHTSYCRCKHHKLIADKVEVVRLLAYGKKWMYELQCLYLLNTVYIDDQSSAAAIAELQAIIAKENVYISKMVSLPLKAYWQQLDGQTFIDGRNVGAKLLSAAILMPCKSNIVLLLTCTVMFSLLMKKVSKLKTDCPALPIEQR